MAYKDDRNSIAKILTMLIDDRTKHEMQIDILKARVSLLEKKLLQLENNKSIV